MSYLTFSATLGCDITEQQARRGVSAALAKSRELGVKMCIGVVDAGANLKYFARMDDSLLGKLDLRNFFFVPTEAYQINDVKHQSSTKVKSRNLFRRPVNVCAYQRSS